MLLFFTMLGERQLEDIVLIVARSRRESSLRSKNNKVIPKLANKEFEIIDLNFI